jgi:CO dehydrogenase/acetyl-CoA synthase alpha subunit
MADFIAILSAATSVDDTLVRRQGMGLIDGSIPGYILLMGDDIARTHQLLDSIKDTNILVFVDDAALS